MLSLCAKQGASEGQGMGLYFTTITHDTNRCREICARPTPKLVLRNVCFNLSYVHQDACKDILVQMTKDLPFRSGDKFVVALSHGTLS
jgi:hypothetical protein